MRLRQSNRTKRFGPPDVPDLGLSDDSDERSAHLPRRDSSEDEFVVEELPARDSAHYRGSDDEDDDEDEEDEEEEDDDEDDLHAHRSSVRAEPRAKSSRRLRRPPIRPKGPPNPVHEEYTREVPPYPTDPGQRWTRSYLGPLKRWSRPDELIDSYFGDIQNYGRAFEAFLKLWWDHALIPPKLQSKAQLSRVRDGWLSRGFARAEEDRFRRWHAGFLEDTGNPQRSTLIDKAEAFRLNLPQACGECTALLGHVSEQKQYSFSQGRSVPLSDAGNPIDEDDGEPVDTAGWILDVGGIVSFMGWAPAQGEGDQLLALAVVPFADQAFYQDLHRAPQGSVKNAGTVQIWKLQADRDPQGIAQFAPRPPKLVHALCLPWGRITRMQWCPVPPTADYVQGLLAVLCSDGKLRVVEVRKRTEVADGAVFEEIHEPMLTISPPVEHTIQITCFTWVTMNRIAAGLSDGSVVLWSISPCQILQRHPIHSSAVMDIVSGYPSDPFIVGTMPVGGSLTVTDLNRPSAETTYHPNTMINLTPGLFAWVHHLRGFASMWPSAFPGNPNVSFLQARVFPLSRHIITTVDGQPSCLAVGAGHPYILLGATDGSVWVFNVLLKVFAHKRATYKLRLFQHEFHSPITGSDKEDREAPRGACRILHGFLPEPNYHPTHRGTGGVGVGSKAKDKGKGKGKAQPPKRGAEKKADGADGSDAGEDTKEYRGPIAIYDAQTRITAVAWNPNAEYSWWAAAAMGSGLVRIMDLGAEREDGDDADVDAGSGDNAPWVDGSKDEDQDVDMDTGMDALY